MIHNKDCKQLNKIITSGIKITHGVLAWGSNSVLFASERFMTFLAYSTTAICIPRHIPRYGTLFSRAYWAARIFPWTPLSPKPPGTKMPSAPWNKRYSDNHDQNIYMNYTCEQFNFEWNVGENSSPSIKSMLIRKHQVPREVRKDHIRKGNSPNQTYRKRKTPVPQFWWSPQDL
jgi:hypothetical protein